jgi:hypothetical protein
MEESRTHIVRLFLPSESANQHVTVLSVQAEQEHLCTSHTVIYSEFR